MNLIVCKVFNAKCDYYNTTGDHNIIKGLLKLSHDNNNYKTLGEDVFVNKINQSFETLEKFCGKEINSIISIQSRQIINNNLPKDIKIYQYIVDIHGWDYYINSITKYTNINLILPYGYSYNRFNYELKATIFYFPHCVSHEVQFNEKPTCKILVSGRGRKNPQRYPMRVNMYDRSLRDSRIDYFKPDHGYRVVNENELNNVTCGEIFIKLLSTYLVCFVDDMVSYSPYIVCKFFEVLSSGSLLLASLDYAKTYFDKLGFIDGEDYILVTKDNLSDKINYVMDVNNIELINKIRYSGYLKCKKYHNCYHRALQLNEIITNDKSVTKYNDGLNGTEYYVVSNNI